MRREYWIACGMLAAYTLFMLHGCADPSPVEEEDQINPVTIEGLREMMFPRSSIK